jgi:hypothetical protein
MKKSIDDLLVEIGQDKPQNMSTTSYLFKRGVYSFFEYGFEDKVAVEFGTHRGQTTRILANLFRKVYTINVDESPEAQRLNQDLDNIEYMAFNLYGNPLDALKFPEPVACVFIDAGHDYPQVVHDIQRMLTLDLEEPAYVIFDDYGLANSVYNAVHRFIGEGHLDIVAQIGHEAGHNFGGTPNRIIMDWEGVICLVKK